MFPFWRWDWGLFYLVLHRQFKIKRGQKIRQKRRQSRDGHLNGYFTVEASLIIPTVILLIAFLFYLTFFLYNRCVLSQDAYVLAFRGSIRCGYRTDSVKRYMEEQMLRQSKAKYIGLGRLERETNVSAGEVTATVRGGMRVPRQWRFTVEKKAQRICPVEKIRRFRLAEKILEEAKPPDQGR